MLPIRWNAKALDELDAIADYIAQFNPIAAEGLQDLIEVSVLPLSDHPYPAKRDGGNYAKLIPSVPNGTYFSVCH